MVPTLTVNPTTAIVGKTVLVFTVTPTPSSDWFLFLLPPQNGEWDIPAGVGSYSLGPFGGPGWPPTLSFNAFAGGSAFTNTVTVSIQYEALPLSASLSASPNSGPVPLAVTFTIGASGGVPPYTGTLDYGDGVTGTVPVPGTWDHMYQKVGAFTATLTVTDALGASGLSRSVTYAGVLPIPDIVSLISGLAPLIAVASVVAASELQRAHVFG